MNEAAAEAQERFRDDALEALRLGWNDMYEFGVGLDGYWARRRDGYGKTMIDEDPDRVRQMVRDDYSVAPGLRGGSPPAP